MHKLVSVRAEIHYLERVQVGLLPSATYPATAKSFIFPQTLPQEATRSHKKPQVEPSTVAASRNICEFATAENYPSQARENMRLVASAGKRATRAKRGKVFSQCSSSLLVVKKEDPRFLFLLVYSVQLTKLLINCRAR